MREISLSFAGSWLTIVILLAVALLIATYFYYRRTNPPIPKGWKAILSGCRSVAFVLLIFSLAEPVFSYLHVSNLPPHLAVLFDNSESIKTVEDFESKGNLLAWLGENPFPGENDANLVRDDYVFSDSLVELKPPLTFDGKRTSLGNCLNTLQNLYADQNLQAVIIISDGLVNSGINPIKAASELSIPIYALDMGPQRSSKDIRIVNVIHDEVGYEGRVSEIELELESRGFKKLTVPMKIRSGGKTLLTSEVNLTGENTRQKVKFEFVPPEQGLRTFSVSIPTQPDEELTDNNRRSFSMKILKSKQRVLVAAGYLSWEFTFLKRVLESSDEFECDYSVLNRTGKLKTIPFPHTAEKLNEYDLIILLDYPPSDLKSRVEALKTYLTDHGKAVMFMLGYESAGRFRSGELAKLLPYRFPDRLVFRSDGSFHLHLTEQGKYHPIMQIAEPPSQLQKAWDNLPPFEGYLTVGHEKPGATVLAVHPEPDNNGELIPLVTISRVGKGKVLTTSLAPIWQIDFLMQRKDEAGKEYQKFVNNCIRWLVTTEDIEKIRIAPDKQVFKSGENITFSATILDESYQAVDDASVILTVLPDSGTVGDTLIISMIRTDPGKMKADLHLMNHGQYRFLADVMRDDKKLTSVSGKFVVEAFSLEEETLYEREDMLKELAATTGGHYFPISMLDSVITEMNLSTNEHHTRHEHPLANNWAILLAVLVLLSLEWAFRKRLQLL